MGIEKIGALLPALVAGTGLILALAVALPLTLFMSSWGTPQSTKPAIQTVSAGELRAVVGRP